MPRAHVWLALCACSILACSKGDDQERERVRERVEASGSATEEAVLDEGPVSKRSVLDVLLEASSRLRLSFFVQRDTSRSVRCAELEIPKHPSRDRLRASLTEQGFDVIETEHGWLLDGFVQDLPRACEDVSVAVIDRGVVTEAAPKRRPLRKPLPVPDRVSQVTEEEAIAALKKLGPEEFEVGPAAVDYLRFGPVPLRLALDRGGGGMRLRGIRPRSVFSALGLHSMDRILAFNDVSLEDEEKIQRVWVDASVPVPPKIKLRVLRGSEQIELRYTILPAVAVPPPLPPGAASSATPPP